MLQGLGVDSLRLRLMPRAEPVLLSINDGRSATSLMQIMRQAELAICNTLARSKRKRD